MQITANMVDDLFSGDPEIEYRAFVTGSTTFMKMDRLHRQWCQDLARMLTVVAQLDFADRAVMDGRCPVPAQDRSSQNWQSYAEGLLAKIESADWSVAQSRYIVQLLKALKASGGSLHGMGQVSFKKV